MVGWFGKIEMFFQGKELKSPNIELVGLALRKNTKLKSLPKDNLIAFKGIHIEFYISNEKIVEHLKNKKINILDIYASEFENDFNMLSFIFKVNIIVYKHTHRYGVVMFDLVQITNKYYKKYIFIYKNENGIYESISLNKNVIHESGPLIDYVKFYYDEHDNVILI